MAPNEQIMPGWRERLGFLAMVLGMFMAILDIQIVSSSLSEIQAGLSASPDEISWIQTAYLIAEVIMIPLSGFLARLLSTRVLFTISAVGFTSMSLACAAASSIDSMIVLRALQGFLGGAMIPSVFAAAFVVFPPRQQAATSVMIGLVATMAPTIGPTLGGYLTEIFSWHWLFLINTGPGIIVAISVWILVDFDKPDKSLMQGFDFTGLVSLATFLGALEYVLEEGPRNDWLHYTPISVMAIVSIIGAMVFFWRTLTYHNPIVDITAFADRNFALSSFFSFVIGVGLYGSVYLLPLFLAQVRGFNSLQIGQILMVTGIFQFLSAPVAGMLSNRMSRRLMLAIGLSFFALGTYLNSFLTADSSFVELFLPQAVRGMSLMLCFLPINTLALGTLPADKIQNASGLFNLMRNLGGALGLAGLNTVLIDRGALHYSRIAESVTAARPAVQNFMAHAGGYFEPMISGDSRMAALKTLTRLAEREANIMRFNDAFMVVSFVFFVSIFLVVFLHKPKNQIKGGH